jgi:hypothetical protein
VRVSQQVLEWQAEAALRTRKENVLRLLQLRCKAPVPSDLADAIDAIGDMNVLLRWFDVAVEASSYDEFRATIQAGH